MKLVGNQSRALKVLSSRDGHVTHCSLLTTSSTFQKPFAPDFKLARRWNPRFVKQTDSSLRSPSTQSVRCSLHKTPDRADTSMDRPFKVLMVCLGNICRSPTAEAVFRANIEKSGFSHRYVVDSCGTGGGSRNWYMPGGFSYHEGDPADPRMTSVAAKRGVRLTSRSRPLRPDDLLEFDLILGMDSSNIAAIEKAARHWEETGLIDPSLNGTWMNKVRLITSYIRDPQLRGYEEVPDPYYGGEQGFHLVLDLLEDACYGVLEACESQNTTHPSTA